MKRLSVLEAHPPESAARHQFGAGRDPQWPPNLQHPERTHFSSPHLQPWCHWASSKSRRMAFSPSHVCLFFTWHHTSAQRWSTYHSWSAATVSPVCHSPASYEECKEGMKETLMIFGVNQNWTGVKPEWKQEQRFPSLSEQRHKLQNQINERLRSPSKCILSHLKAR